jgi:hypothetical protein
MLDAAPQSDRRDGSRQRVLKKALIVFNNGHSTVGCHILDISEVGAKLLPTDVASCPREFALKSLTGEPRQCEVIWCRGGALGVRFLDLDQSEKTAEDRRRHTRRRALQPALIVCNRGLSTMVCQVIDISEMGAKLILPMPSHARESSCSSPGMVDLATALFFGAEAPPWASGFSDHRER